MTTTQAVKLQLEEKCEPTMGHLNRSKTNRTAAANPTPVEVRAAREKAGLTQTEAAEVIYGTLRAWQNWENDQDPNEQRRMHPGLFELFLAKTGQLRKDYYDKLLAAKNAT